MIFAGDEILYGTADGKIGVVQIGDQTSSVKWELDNDKKKGGICLLFLRMHYEFKANWFYFLLLKEFFVLTPTTLLEMV